MSTPDTSELTALRAEVTRLRALLYEPELLTFRDAVVFEAAHQRERWGSEHDAGKTPADWHWLVAHLAGKALFHAQELQNLAKQEPGGPAIVRSLIQRHREKATHHCITTAAAVANWHAAMLGLTNMRPGIDVPQAPGVQANIEVPTTLRGELRARPPVVHAKETSQ